ncbi:response regulator transcription factor [Defluviimonas sp. WL0002]|uniref:Response regulator transcription factor n=1 Tax=Albidovulum marisflavi TaxID=2984159 RepID=A0ABT2ZBK6_9RHOB|nr:response regulator transcription factor [Defluviimonas sp. WL0002]MCV2868402.1 response regulator transcription factor [Defluviimonas sp. WL0002]
MAGKAILVVDDDAAVRTLLRRCLASDGFDVCEAATGDEALTLVQGRDFDLITLDLNLNGSDGFDVARRICRVSSVPIVMVTGRGDVIDRVAGLELGADDYITKPFHVREVLARVHSVLRRVGGDTFQKPVEAAGGALREFTFAGFRAIPDTLEFYNPQGHPIELTAGDFRLLTVFLEHPREVLSRERIMNLVNGVEWTPLDRTIDNQVARLRKKIEAVPSAPKLIKTVRGVGYTFAAEVSGF